MTVPKAPMKILVIGAGVIGSLYAGRLAQTGHSLTLYARGQRLAQLRQQGLVIKEHGSGQPVKIAVRVIDQLSRADECDLVMVVVRKTQLGSVLSLFAQVSESCPVLFFVNNAEGPQAIIDVLGSERVLLGFPGAGGENNGGVIQYSITSGLVQPTTIGELDGRLTERVRSVAACLRAAGFPVAISKNIDAWLKTHVALVSPIANAIYMADGSNYQLARRREDLALMVRAIKEAFRALRTSGIPLTPWKFQIIPWLPERLLVPVLARFFGTPQAELILARHANAARDEMSQLSEELLALVRQAGTPAPNLVELHQRQKALFRG